MMRVLRQISVPLMAVLAAAAFWVLSHGGVGSALSLRGYAEVIDYPVAPLADGKLATVTVRLGQRVKAGDVVATMDTRALEIQREVAKIELARARAELGAAAIVERASVARAELQTLRLRTQQSRDKAQLAEVQQQLVRLEKLAAEKLVEARDVERERLRQADLAASVAELDAASGERQAGLGRALRERHSNKQVARRVEPYREAVRLREAELQAAELAIAESTLRAPADGTVAAVMHHPGEVVKAGIEIVRVSAGRPGFVVLWVPERVATKVEAARAVRVSGARLLDRGFGGRVVEVAPAIEEVPVRARVSPMTPSWGRRVVIESSPPQPLVPGEALNVRF